MASLVNYRPNSGKRQRSCSTGGHGAGDGIQQVALRIAAGQRSAVVESAPHSGWRGTDRPADPVPGVPVRTAVSGTFPMGYTHALMESIWVESLARSFDQALDLMTTAVTDCTDERWETPMWEVRAPAAEHQFLSTDWNPVTDAGQRDAIGQLWVQRWSTPWSVAWHALELLDYDLNGESGPWAPPPPFNGHPHWRDLANLPAAWSRPEILAYTDYCRQRVRDTLAGMTTEAAETPLPPAHRYQGQPRARIITSLVGHTTEHASQIRQFLTSARSIPGS